MTKAIYLDKCTSEIYWAYLVSPRLSLHLFICPYHFKPLPLLWFLLFGIPCHCLSPLWFNLQRNKYAESTSVFLPCGFSFLYFSSHYFLPLLFNFSSCCIAKSVVYGIFPTIELKYHSCCYPQLPEFSAPASVSALDSCQGASPLIAVVWRLPGWCVTCVHLLQCHSPGLLLIVSCDITALPPRLPVPSTATLMPRTTLENELSLCPSRAHSSWLLLYQASSEEVCSILGHAFHSRINKNCLSVPPHKESPRKVMIQFKGALGKFDSLSERMLSKRY